jgi:hypothetical protein
MVNATVDWLPVGLASADRHRARLRVMSVRLARDGTRETPSAGNAVSAAARRILDERFAR